MDDLFWMKFFEKWCEANDLRLVDVRDTFHSRNSETYLLAHRQFVGGASDRVVSQLLRRAAIESGLIDTTE